MTRLKNEQVLRYSDEQLMIRANAVSDLLC